MTAVEPSFNQDLFALMLLQRAVDIENSISVQLDGNDQPYRAKFAYPRWWESIKGSYPGYFNKVVRLNSVHGGRPIRKDKFILTVRLVIGPAFAGYKGEYEDMGNAFYLATINRFDADQRLGDPVDPMHAALQYVESALIIGGDAGIAGKTYDDNPRTALLCIDIPIEVTANFMVARTS